MDQFGGGGGGSSGWGQFVGYLGSIFGGGSGGNGQSLVPGENPVNDYLYMGNSWYQSGHKNLVKDGGKSGGVSYAPTTVFNLQGEGGAETEKRMRAYVDQTNQRNFSEFERKLSRNGVEVR